MDYDELAEKLKVRDGDVNEKALRRLFGDRFENKGYRVLGFRVQVLGF